MRKALTVLVGMVVLSVSAFADWKPAQVSQFEAWKAVPAAQRYSGVNGKLLGVLLHANQGVPSVAQCEAVIVVVSADSEAGVPGPGKGNGGLGYLSAAQRAKTRALGKAASGTLAPSQRALIAAEAVFASAGVYAASVGQMAEHESMVSSFYYAAWRNGHYNQTKRNAQFIEVCGYQNTPLVRLFKPSLMPQLLNDPATLREGACAVALARASQADVLLDGGVIKMVVQRNALGELSDADAANILGKVVKQSWTKVQLDFPEDDGCSEAQLTKKIALKAAANKVASVLDGIVSTM